MKILGTLADQSACGYYRIVLPLAELRQRGHRTRVTQFLWPMEQDEKVPDPLYPGVDVMLVQRICSHELADFLLDKWAASGRKIVYELDDLVTHLDVTNTQAHTYYTPERIDAIRRIMRGVDAILTTTDTLADELREYNPNVYVCPNSLPNWTAGISQHRVDSDGPLRIVYTGGSSHFPDVTHYRYGIGKTIRRLGDKVTCTTYGHPWLKELGLTEAPHLKVRQWTPDFAQYQLSLTSYDVGLAPLKAGRFNASKSNIKVLEYWAAGVVPIVSPLVYDTTVRDGVDGFVCRTDSDWRRAIEACVEDREMVAKMRAAGYERVAEHLVCNNVHSWETALEEVVA